MIRGIREELDIFAARRDVRELALDAGFDRFSAAELCVAASELAWNILKFAGQGTIEARAIDEPGRGRAVEIAAVDAGPPIRDFALALEDGCTDLGPIAPEDIMRRGGLGGGLGAVRRFTDRLEHHVLPIGKRIVAVRWRRR